VSGPAGSGEGAAGAAPQAEPAVTGGTGEAPRPARGWRGHIQLVLDLGSAAGKGADPGDEVRRRRGALRRAPARVAVEAARGGVDSIQVRGKGLSAGELLEQVLAIKKALREEGFDVPVLVNERLDVALLAGADGIHLPERSLSPAWAGACRTLARRGREQPEPEPAPARAAGGPGVPEQAGRERAFVVGRSVHSADAASEPGTEHLDYLIFGHVFATASKPGVPPRGLGALAEAAAVSPVPVLAIGGIDAANAARVIEAGAAGVAVISAVAGAADPYAAAKALRRAVDAALARRPSAG